MPWLRIWTPSPRWPSIPTGSTLFQEVSDGTATVLLLPSIAPWFCWNLAICCRNLLVDVTTNRFISLSHGETDGENPISAARQLIYQEPLLCVGLPGNNSILTSSKFRSRLQHSPMELGDKDLRARDHGASQEIWRKHLRRRFSPQQALHRQRRCRRSRKGLRLRVRRGGKQHSRPGRRRTSQSRG